jgi:hypothetical protein
MSIRGFSNVVVIACLMLIVCGCSRPNIVGTDAAVYSRGALYAVSGKDLNSVYAATVKALEQLEIEVVEKEKDVFYAKVVGEIADGMNVVVRLEPGDNNVTELSIKASALGNEDRSRVIYQKIQEILGTGAGSK